MCQTRGGYRESVYLVFGECRWGGFTGCWDSGDGGSDDSVKGIDGENYAG